MKPYALTRQALADLKAIAIFTEKNWGKDKRNEYLQEMDETLALLGQHPEMGVACDVIAKGYRKFPKGRHVLFFKANAGEPVLIVRILHKNRDATQHLEA